MRFVTNELGERFVEATPEETRSLRPRLCAALRIYGCPRRDIEDIAQEVEVTTWQCMGEGRVQGFELTDPRRALFQFMRVVAWQLCMNRHRLCSNRCVHLSREETGWDFGGAAPDEFMEARDLLHRLSRYPGVFRLLVGRAIGKTVEELAHEAGIDPHAFHFHIKRFEEWAKRLSKTGLWQKPPLIHRIRRKVKKQDKLE